MASHRLPDEERPRRAVPAWVTAPPEGVHGAGASAHGHDAVDGLEARPAPVMSAPVPETAGSRSTVGTPGPGTVGTPGPGTVGTPDPGTVGTPGSGPVGPAAEVTASDFVVPDYPPDEALLPPAPTSPTVSTVPFDTASVVPRPVPVSPIDAAPPAPVTPAVPVVGQPRFSVPGLEHVVVEGTEPEPVGPIGYRTPARFAHQRPAATAPGTTSTPAPAVSAPTRAFDALITPPAPTPTPAPAPAPVPTRVSSAGPATAANDAGATSATAPPAVVRESVEAATGLQVDATGSAAKAAPVGATPGAVLGAVTGLVTLGLAAWWFLAPETVHGVGVALGVVALLVSVVTLRNAAATWQRPVALLGAVLGGVGTLVLLWAVASALLPMAGVTLPDVTGAGVVPTLAP